MSTFDYINREVGEAKLRTLIAEGLISSKIPLYMEIYRYHTTHGGRRSDTTREFGLPVSTIGYALQRMKQPISRK